MTYGASFAKVSAVHPEAERYCWVDVRIRTAASVSNVDARHNGETPTGGDHDPSSALSFRALEQAGCNYTVPKQTEARQFNIQTH